MLPADEVRQRIVAARVLLGMSQDEMSQQGHEEWGLGKHELARAERGTNPVQPYHLRILTEILQVPMSWFTEPREAIVAQRPQDLDQVLGVLERWLKEQAAGGEAPPRSQTRGRGR
jgi:transcriptional regulator with XRE-family HTH domain